MQKVSQAFILAGYKLACSEWQSKLECKFPKAFVKTGILKRIEESVKAIRDGKCYDMYPVLFDVDYIYIPLPRANREWTLDAYEWMKEYLVSNSNAYPVHIEGKMYPKSLAGETSALLIEHRIPIRAHIEETNELFDVEESFIKEAYEAAPTLQLKESISNEFRDMFYPKFPKTMKQNKPGTCNYGMIVFFTEKEKGTVIKRSEREDGWPLGHFTSMWVMEHFEDCDIDAK